MARKRVVTAGTSVEWIVGRDQTHRSSSSAFPGASAGSWIEVAVEQPGLEPAIPYEISAFQAIV